MSRVAVIVLAIVGVSCLVASLMVATKQYTVSVKGQKFKCGSVLSSKDPRDLVSNRRQVTPRYKRANSLCNKKGSKYAHQAITLFVAGVIPLLIVLMIPALERRSRMARGRRRTRI